MEEKLESWWDKVFTRYCPDCKNPCCSGTRHIITFDPSDDLSLFLELGINIHPWDSLNKESVIGWYSRLPALAAKRVILDKGGNLIEQPALIEIPENIATLAGSGKGRLKGEEFTVALYVHRSCPFFDNSTRLCKVHKDSRRPACCKTHPLIFFEENGKKVIGIQKGCHLNSVFDELEKEFPEGEYILRKDVEGGNRFK
jgi:Fe-S-cluster containining protein